MNSKSELRVWESASIKHRTGGATCAAAGLLVEDLMMAADSLAAIIDASAAVAAAAGRRRRLPGYATTSWKVVERGGRAAQPEGPSKRKLPLVLQVCVILI